MRELDVWIALNVMGWKRMTFNDYLKTCGFNERLTNYYHNLDGSIAADFDWACDCGQTNTSWRPTDNPAHAMEVLKKCCERGCGKFSTVIWKFQGEWNIDAQCVDVKDEFNAVEAETLELAICQFAKKLFTK